MKITDIRIESYGVWNHLALPLQSAGLNVFYGPNEAGKTTLLRFIRDVLYGSHSLESNAPHARQTSWNGALRLANAQRFCEVRRWRDLLGSGGLEFQELDPGLAWSAEPLWGSESEQSDGRANVGQPAKAALEELLAGTHAQLFRHVFAIGLNELQELATLEDDEVAEQIYGLSLGSEGRKLLAISSQLGTAPATCPNASENFERLAQLLTRDAELARELEHFMGQRDRHQTLLNQQAELEDQIQDLKFQQMESREQLQGHETVKLAWEPWNQVREYEAELRQLPALAEVTGIDPARLSQLENEIRELRRERKSVIADIGRLRKAIRSARENSAHQQLAAEVQGFLGQRAGVMQTERDLELATARARELKTEFEARQQALGRDWPGERLGSIDATRGAYTRLVDAARGFQSAQARQSALRKRYDKYAAACQQRQAELDQIVKALPEQSLDEALENTRQQQSQVEELARLERTESELAERIARDRRELERCQERSRIPQWVPGFLLFLAVSGLCLSALGFYTSLTSNGIAGAILGLVGIAGFAIARGFQSGTQGQEENEFSRQQSVIRQHEQSLREIREKVKEHTPAGWAVTVTEEDAQPHHLETMLASKLSDRLSDLKKLRAQERRLKSRRRRLSRMRKALQARQRDVGEARQAWCEVLKQCGLEETLQIEEAFTLWQKIAETKEHQRAWEAARENAAELHQRHEAFCRRLAEFGERSGQANLDYNHPLRVLDVWQQEFAASGETNQEQLAWKRELQGQKREANRLKVQILKARAARKALLAQVGAANRKEFESKLDSASRRRELEELLKMAKADLAGLALDHPELAIVEEDLLKYDSRQTQEALDLLTMELEDLESRLSEALEALSRVKQELLVLESDRRASEIRLERETLTGKLKECLAEQAAYHLGAKIVSRIRGEFEQTCQPRILEIASDYLTQLTCGNYLKIWTTLETKKLLLMDAEENSFSIQQLSNGTREQLFLALRLALVSEFAQRGIELPIVLDDVLVNFDQYRTEAAIQTLSEFADRGHQVLLFTSHLHLARLCESQGIDPVWLPAHHTIVEHRRAG